ncbi:hypothetical protein P8452_03111 [Trifolium repens]|nr:hypothetical protein P8452_03111 [Trifolium repens]
MPEKSFIAHSLPVSATEYSLSRFTTVGTWNQLGKMSSTIKLKIIAQSLCGVTLPSLVESLRSLHILHSQQSSMTEAQYGLLIVADTFLLSFL